MPRTHCASDWQDYRMDYKDPHREVEPLPHEIQVVDKALAVLQEEGVLAHTAYDHEKMLAHRKAVRELLEIPWTAITLRMQRLLYALNAIVQPPVMIAAGVFCGYTFICNAGAAIGPGACYRAKDLVGIEIDTSKAAQAEANVRRFDPTGVARIVAADAVEVVKDYAHNIDVLYLDVNGDRGRGKSIYLEILRAAYDKLPRGAIVLAHNSANCAEQLKDYFAFVRDPAHFQASVNVVIDREGIEVTAR
jgi:predicted O-methyltransferase YrrM